MCFQSVVYSYLVPDICMCVRNVSCFTGASVWSANQNAKR